MTFKKELDYSCVEMKMFTTEMGSFKTYTEFLKEEYGFVGSIYISLFRNLITSLKSYCDGRTHARTHARTN
jgi:hypothetical protein